MNRVKLGELVSITGGGTPDRSNVAFWGGDIPWATVKDFKSLEISSTTEHITKEGLNSSAANLITAGAIIVPTRMALGKAAINTVSVAINQDLKALRVRDPKIVDRDYLFRFILSKAAYLESRGQGATVKGITLDVLRDLDVPLPPIRDQQRIATTLDKADSIRRKRKDAILLANDFLKAVFIEMFGDPVTNPMGWTSKDLGEVCSKIGSGATPKGGDSAYKDEGIALIRSMNVRDGSFLWKDLARIDDEQAARLSNVVVQADDVLINITGASVARVCRAPREVIPARVNQHVSILRPNHQVRPEFLEQLLLTSYVKSQLLQIGEAGATRQAITKGELETFRIIVPPKQLQDRFAMMQLKVSDLVQKASSCAQTVEHLRASLQSNFFEI